jgi:hypothetical protein
MRQHAIGIVVVLTALALVLSATSCGGDPVSATTSPVATWYVIFVDCSISPGKEQRVFWADAAQRLVFQHIRPGDALTVFEVSERTADLAPLKDGAVPPLDGSSGMEETIRVRQIIASLRKEGLAAITNALQNPAAKETHLLDSLDRIPRTGTRKVFVLYLTDAFEASPELNLEQTKLTDKNVAAFVHSAMLHHNLQPNAFIGVTVQFVLDSPAPTKARALNNHKALENFWRLLWANVGADLKAFDSRICE